MRDWWGVSKPIFPGTVDFTSKSVVTVRETLIVSANLRYYNVSRYLGGSGWPTFRPTKLPEEPSGKGGLELLTHLAGQYAANPQRSTEPSYWAKAIIASSTATRWSTCCKDLARWSLSNFLIAPQPRRYLVWHPEISAMLDSSSARTQLIVFRYERPVFFHVHYWGLTLVFNSSLCVSIANGSPIGQAIFLLKNWARHYVVTSSLRLTPSQYLLESLTPR